ncbi:MAG: hypothetical protein LBB81_04510 [Treponema sp.]|jgi:hypothetical protein|nr:hypothetical protein [Treponema sp.]
MRPFFSLLIIFLCAFPLFSLDLPSNQIPDDSMLRIKTEKTWLRESPNKVFQMRPAIHVLESGSRVEIRCEEGKDEFMVIFSHELMSGTISDNGTIAVQRGGTGQFPGWAQGSWMLTRNKRDGKGTLIRIFPRSDPQTYVQLRPANNEKCVMDVIAYGGYLIRSMTIGVPFDFLYTMPVNDVFKLAGPAFPRRYFDPIPENYTSTRRLISQIRDRTGPLEFYDDGAIDENGDYVFIATLEKQTQKNKGLNCSGFTKWLIDGILRPVTGSRLLIQDIKAPFGDRGSSFTDRWEESEDPFFGLDWIRNLAAAANSALRSPVYAALDEFEVRNDYFSAVQISENSNYFIQPYPGFLDNAGYGAEGLFPLLYTLAIDNPFSFYLAAVNTESGAPITQNNPRGAPRLRKYYHVAALFPYFNEAGAFRIAVFESAAETSFTGFRSRYKGQYINLVQIPVANTFDP